MVLNSPMPYALYLLPYAFQLLLLCGASFAPRHYYVAFGDTGDL